MIKEWVLGMRNHHNAYHYKATVRRKKTNKVVLESLISVWQIYISIVYNKMGLLEVVITLGTKIVLQIKFLNCQAQPTLSLNKLGWDLLYSHFAEYGLHNLQ